MNRALAALRRRPLLAVPVVGFAVAAALLSMRILDLQRTATPVLVPVYEIEAISGTHRASLLNLPVGQPGVIQAPVPVDIDGDLLPDVEVAVNLINAEGLFENPPEPNEVLAPNIRIARFLAPGLPLGRPLAPLRINVKLTIKDAEGTQPDTFLRFGYDTASGGSIPGQFDAVVSGLDTFFNPLEAVIDTKTGPMGADAVPIQYEGPLALVAGVQQGDFKADADLAYKPWPDAVRFTYSSDDAGQHLDYAHGIGEEVHISYGTDVGGQTVRYVPGDIPDVDLATKLKVVDGADVLDLSAQIDRLPRQFSTDFKTEEGSGRIDYRAKSDGRAPDGNIVLRSVSGGEVVNARVDIEAIPPEVHALWDLPDEGAVSARFTTVDPDDVDADPKDSPGLGAIEASVANYDGNPTDLVPFVANEHQFLNYQSAQLAAGGTERFISGRVDRIRDITFAETDDGFDAGADVGDGVLPLQLHVDTDELPNSDRLQALATVRPLPDKVAISLHNGSTNDLDDPFRVTYEAAQTVDVDAHLEVREAAAVARACGLSGTLCADLDVRHIPTRLEARLGQEGEGPGQELRVDVDNERRAGSPKPDIILDALLGQDDGLSDPTLAADDPVTTSAHGEFRGIPDHLRLRTVAGSGESLERIDVSTCVITDLDLGTCEAGTEGEIGEVSFNVANFLPGKRPANLPLPSATAPNFANIVGRGLPGTVDTVRFEAAGRLKQINQLRYLSTDGLFGVRSDGGGGRDLQAVVDIRNVDLVDDSPNGGRIDVVGDALVSPLPETIDICLRDANKPLELSSPVPFTDRCESTDPFADGSVDETPLTFAYKAASEFDVKGKFEVTKHGDPATVADEHAALVKFGIENLPTSLTAHVQAPGKDEVGPTRALLTAPGATDLNLDLTAEDRFGGADCDDPDPTVDVECLVASVDDVPKSLSAFIDPTTDAARAEVHACDWDFMGATPACRDSEAEIGSVEVDLRSQTGSPDMLPLPPEVTEPQHVFFQMDQLGNDPDDETDDDVAMAIQGRIERIRHVTFAQAPDGFTAHTDLGDGVKSLQAHVHADTRPEADGSFITADAVVTPLPAEITISQHGPGEDQAADPLEITYDTSAVVDVVADAEIRKTGAGSRCGSHLTVCAHAEITDLPKHLSASLGKATGDPGTGGRRDATTELKLDLTRFDPADPKPNILIDATLGSDDDEAPFDDTPQIARADLDGLPDHVRLKLEAIETVDDNLEPVDSTIERLQFHSCSRDFENEECDDPAGKIDTVDVRVRNFYLRPTQFPPPPVFTTPLYASITQRDDNLTEAVAHITDVEELQYLSRGGLTGLRAKAGDDQNMAVRVDIKGTSLGEEIELGELDVDDPQLALEGDVRFTPLPGDVSLCLREGGLSPVPAPSGLEFTAKCESLTPFGSGVDLEHTPLSVAYTAITPDTGFDLFAEADAVITGTDQDTNSPIPAHRIHGLVDAPDLPKTLEAHVLSPRNVEVATPTGTDMQKEGETRVLLKTDPAAPQGPELKFRTNYLIGDETICADPRKNVEAFCIGGHFKNLPRTADLSFNPEDKTGNNLKLTTNGSGDTDLEGLHASSVTPKRDDEGALVPGKADVMVIDGHIRDIPMPLTAHGDLDLPEDEDDPPAIRLLIDDDPKTPGKDTIGEIKARVVNFTAPDPTAGFGPKPRLGNPGDQQITFVQRGDAFRLDALIRSVRGFGYRAVPAATGKAIGTHEANLDFGDNQDVRAFVDLIADQTQHVLADVLLEDVPAGISVCLRGPRELAMRTAVAPLPTWCDSPANVLPGEGAFQFTGVAGSRTDGMDIDAFIRLVSGGGTSMTTARANIENIPPVVQGTFPGSEGDVEISGFALDGTKDGIDQIDFEAASFDIDPAGTGYENISAAGLPYTPTPTPQTPPFPAPNGAAGRQFAHVALTDADFHARGRIGLTSGPSSQLQHLLLSEKACLKPTQGNRDDYPQFPDDGGRSSYTCIRGDFADPTPEDQVPPVDPLDLRVEKIDDKGEVLRLSGAGLTDVPSWFQATLATTDLYEADNPTTPGDEAVNKTWRRPCRSQTREGNRIDCMPPLVRIDQALDTARIFGTLEVGTDADLKFLKDEVKPDGQLADLNADPNGGWGDWDPTDPKGVRLKMASWGGETEDNDDDNRSALRIGLRLRVPGSINVDQVQEFDAGKIHEAGIPPDGKVGPEKGKEAKDLRLRYVTRDTDGSMSTDIGELTALIHDVGKKEQILVSGACDFNTNDEKLTAPPASCAGYGRGLAIPGELGVQLYTRESVDDVPDLEGDRHKRHSKFFHVDGRVSSPLNAGVRLRKLGGGTTDDIGLLQANIRNTPMGGDVNNPLSPSFRLRAELIKDKNTEFDDIVEFVTKDEVVVNTLFVELDFLQARRIDAVFNFRGARVGADIAGFSTLGGTTPNTAVNADGFVDIDPFNIDLETKVQIPIDPGKAIEKWLTDTFGDIGSVLGKIIKFAIKIVKKAIEAFLNQAGLEVTMKAGLFLQFHLNQTERFRLRLNALHADVTTQGGSAQLGPVNLEMRKFAAGIYFRYKPIELPTALCILAEAVDIPCSIKVDIPIFTVRYVQLADAIVGDNTALDMHECTALEVINPIPSFQNAITRSGNADTFLLYPLTDPRYTSFFVFVPVGPIVDFVLDVIFQPVMCGLFGTEESAYQDIEFTGDAKTANPSNLAVTTFPGHDVPGQPGPENNTVLTDEARTPPACPPSCGLPPANPPPPPGPPVPPPEPPLPPPLFIGPDRKIDTDVSMCGTHTFNTLTVNADVTVTNTVNNSDPFGTGPLCPAGEGGELKLQANTMVVNGTISADQLVTANPDVDPTTFPAGEGFAEGNGGGGHFGAGGDGSAGRGGWPYADTTPQASTFGGAPGAGGGAGPAGGAIVLEGDDQVIVNGTLSAIGGPGTGDGTAGTCDADPDDGPPGDQGDVPNDKDPPYEHVDLVTGSGGGSGGGIVIAATDVDLTGADAVRVTGGNGGPGKGGNGGGGGGGLIKIVAPIYDAGPALEVTAGLPGTATVCAGVPAAAAAAAGSALIVQNPSTDVLASNTFWKAGDPAQTAVARLRGAATKADDNDGLQIALCAVTQPTSVAPINDPNLGAFFTMPTNPATPTQRCGSGGVSPVTISSFTIKDEEFEPPDPHAIRNYTPPVGQQYLGLYTVGFRTKVAGNDCFNPADAGGVNDATACYIEPLPTRVDQVVGVDGHRPTVTITAPANGTKFITGTMPLKLTVTDPPGGSGIQRIECRARKALEDPPWVACTEDNPLFALTAGEGANIVEARAYDLAQNVSSILPASTITVELDQNPPSATAAISPALPPAGQGGWYKEAPRINLSGYDDSNKEGHPDNHPYVWRFDNGGEQQCPFVASPVPRSVTCEVGPSVTGQLFPGVHTFHFTAVDEAKNRLYDDKNPFHPNPMLRLKPGQTCPIGDEQVPCDFKIDTKPPTVAMATVPAQGEFLIGSDRWFATKPYLAFGAIDQVGGSGVARIEYDRSDDTRGFLDYDPADPPRITGTGIVTVCARAYDVATNPSDLMCQDLRVDDQAPTGTLSVGAANGLNGWYVTPPAVTLNGYNDGSGVGATSGHFRFRVDNGGFAPTCTPGCSVPPLGTGQHLVHFTAADSFDNRTTEQTRALNVDLDDPVTTIALAPSAPDGSNDWYLERPFIVLDANDQEGTLGDRTTEGSGVARVEYRFDGAGAWTLYSAPFRPPLGDHELCARATDVAGNVELPVCVNMNVDDADPRAAISAPALPASGWYTSTPAVSLSATDPVPGSGVNAAFDPDRSDLCGHTAPADNPLSPSGICVSVDRAPFAFATGPFVIPEGVHTVRAFSVDVAGRHSAHTTRTVHVDLSPPVTVSRTLPSAPAANNWYRRIPRAVLRAVDGDQNSGLARIESRIDAAAFATYTKPFDVPLGVHTLNFRAFDRAGLVAAAPGASQVRVDNVPPVVKAKNPQPAVWSMAAVALGNQPAVAKLNWELTENLSPTVKVTVLVYNEFGGLARRIDGGTYNVPPATKKVVGFTNWDGRDTSFLGWVPIGIYHYRVIVTDEAGNYAFSGESKPLQIKL